LNRSLSVVLWESRMTWLPVVALVLVLLATFLLVPRESAPFIYEFF